MKHEVGDILYDTNTNKVVVVITRYVNCIEYELITDITGGYVLTNVNDKSLVPDKFYSTNLFKILIGYNQ